MTAGTGDVEKEGRMEPMCADCHTEDCEYRGLGVVPPCRHFTPKPQPQVAPITDFSVCLLNIEKSLSDLADIAESQSVTLGDKYGKLADGCIDSMESVQVLRNQANGIEIDEDEVV